MQGQQGCIFKVAPASIRIVMPRFQNSDANYDIRI